MLCVGGYMVWIGAVSAATRRQLKELSREARQLTGSPKQVRQLWAIMLCMKSPQQQQQQHAPINNKSHLLPSQWFYKRFSGRTLVCGAK